MPNPKRQRKKQGREARQEEIRAQQQRARRKKQAMLGVGTVVFIAVMAALFSRGDSSKAKKVATKNTTTTTAAPGDTTTTSAADDAKVGGAPCPAADGSAEKKASFDGVPAMCIDVAKSYTARVETDAGAFTIAFDAKNAPKTVNNFVFLARYHFYDGVPFHRVIPGFVIQGGDAEKGDGTGGPGYQFADELPKEGVYEVGSLAMANSGPDTNGSQFFVITGPQGVSLPPSYSLFGKVTDGLDVVKKIEADGTPEGKPKVVHKMTRVTITET